MRAFIVSVLIGALVPAAPLMLLTSVALTGMFSGSESPAGAIWFTLLPLVVTLPIVLVASLLLGLPLTWLLHRYRRESHAAYVLGGGLLGCVSPAIILMLIDAADGWLIVMPMGGLSGAVTGHSWWRHAREPLLYGRPA